MMQSKIFSPAKKINNQTNKLSSDEEKYIIEKSKQNRNRIILLLTVTIYALMAVFGTTDEDILFLNPVQTPLIKIALPLIAFYVGMPLFILALHFNTVYMFNQNKTHI